MTHPVQSPQQAQGTVLADTPDQGMIENGHGPSG
jgi:hypothetical protein